MKRDFLKNESYGERIVRYPSYIFELTPLESWPYERMVYNTFRNMAQSIAPEQLDRTITVNYLTDANFAPWVVNAGVKWYPNSTQCDVSIPLFLPIQLFAFAASFIQEFINNKHGVDLVAARTKYVLAIHDGMRAASNLGNSSGIRAVFNAIGCEIGQINDGGLLNIFETLASVILNHEIGHIQTDKLSWCDSVSEEDYITHTATELIADLCGIYWLYDLYIRKTPDTDAYRANSPFDHMDSYENSIFMNSCLLSLCVYTFPVLTYTTIKPNGGIEEITQEDIEALETMSTHPHQNLRIFVQTLQLQTLIFAKFEATMGEENAKKLDFIWAELQKMLEMLNILLPRPNMRSDYLTDSDIPILVRTAELIRKENIAGLSGFVKVLEQSFIRKHFELPYIT